MGYANIGNLYKEKDILLFKECYALCKIDGTSAHIAWSEGKIRFFSGGATHSTFESIFDQAALVKIFEEDFGQMKVIIHGEAYGAKIQKMSETYGKLLKFIVFDVKVEDSWLSVPRAENVANRFGLEFVHYVKIPADLEHIDAERDADSVQAVRNGMGVGHMREGVVLRPLIELTKNNGERIIAKHKRDEFRERTHVPKVLDADKAAVLTDAKAIADEWVVPMRLAHILQDLPHADGMEHTGEVVKAMIADVFKESKGEIVESKDVEKAIGKKTVELWKNYIKTKTGM